MSVKKQRVNNNKNKSQSIKFCFVFWLKNKADRVAVFVLQLHKKKEMSTARDIFF